MVKRSKAGIWSDDEVEQQHGAGQTVAHNYETSAVSIIYWHKFSRCGLHLSSAPITLEC